MCRVSRSSHTSLVSSGGTAPRLADPGDPRNSTARASGRARPPRPIGSFLPGFGPLAAETACCLRKRGSPPFHVKQIGSFTMRPGLTRNPARSS
jgi:hypothetical protein